MYIHLHTIHNYAHVCIFTQIYINSNSLHMIICLNIWDTNK